MRILSFLFFLAAASLANAQIYQHDISADTVLQPPIRGFINLPTSVYIKFTNKGTSDEINVKLFVRITNYLNKLVYADTQSIDSLWLSGQTKKIAFRDFTPPGLHGYEVTAIAVLLGDQNNFNDTAFSSFCVGYESDVAALSITNPTKNEVKPIKALFQPQGIFWVPGGCFDFTNIPVRVQIVRCSDDQLVFRADTIMPNIPLDSAGASISFPYKQGNYNIQNLAIGCYRITIIANKPDDGDRTNDTAYSNFFIGSGDYILAEGFESPQPDAHLNRDSSIPITAQFKNIGIYPETRVIVGVDVQDRKGNMIMQDSSIQTNWSINESRTITFKSFSSSSNGTFTITAWTYIGNGTGVRINIGDQCDIAVLSVANPSPNEKILEGVGFIPAGIFRSEGYDQYMTNIPISLRIFQSSDMHLVIELDSSISLINADSGDMKFPFPSRNSEGGTVDLTPGHYKLCIYSRLPDYVTCDPNQTNDTACTNFEILPAASVENPSNTIFSLTQNFPNPFSATTIIKYYLPENEKIVFRIIDAIGRIVYEKEEQEDSGQHELPITPEQFINGIFTYQLTGINDRGEISTISKKMILLK